MTPDLVERLKRVVAVARATAAGGRFPMVLEDANVLMVRLGESPGSDPATTVSGEITLDGERLSVTQAARLVGCSPQAIRKAIGSTRLAAAKNQTGAWMIRPADLEQYRHGGHTA